MSHNYFKVRTRLGDETRGITCETCGAGTHRDTIITFIDLDQPRTGDQDAEDHGIHHQCEKCHYIHTITNTTTTTQQEILNYLSNPF